MNSVDFRCKLAQIDGNNPSGTGVAVIFLANGKRIITRTCLVDMNLGYVFLRGLDADPDSPSQEFLYSHIVDVQDLNLVRKDLSL